MAAILLVVGILLCWALNFIGVPGNWLVLGLTAIHTLLVGTESRWNVDWLVMLALLALALVGELIEFVAGAWGVSKSGGSKRGAALAIVGSFVAGLAGLFVGIGIPIPVVGSLLSALLFAGLGALAGAVVGEQWKGRDLDESLRIGQAAFWGRLLGTLGKALVGIVMLVVIVVALIF